MCKRRSRIIALVAVVIVIAGPFLYGIVFNILNKPDMSNLEEYNNWLESTPHYNMVIDDVMREVYTTYTKEQIEQSELYLKKMNEKNSEYYEGKQRIEKAKELLSTDPEMAAELYIKMGSCHELWYLQKKILQEKYGITWYTPSEINPNVIYD